MSKQRQLLVLGLDGADFELIGDWLDEGDLPNLQKLIRRGTSGPLRSSRPPVTSPAWKCYSTGKNPANLGVFWWRQVDRNNRRIVGAEAGLFRGAEIWDYLGSAGYQSGVVGMPLTYPPKAIRGVMVAGDPYAREEGYTFPPEFRRFLEEKFSYRIRPRQLMSVKAGPQEEAVEEILRVIRQKFQVAGYFLETGNFDFVHMTTFYLNHMQHTCWKGEPSRRAWKLVDEEVGKLVRPERNVIVMSDHGSREVKIEFYLNNWLLREGYLSLKIGTLAVLARRVKKIDRCNILKTLARGVLPREFQRGVSDRLPTEATEAVPFEKCIDWERTRAIAMPQGTLYLTNCPYPDEYFKVRDEIIRKLEAVTDPEDGSKIINAIHKKEDIYQGRFFESAPDLYVEARPDCHIREGTVGRKKLINPAEGWRATNYEFGILIAAGPDIRAGREIDHARIIDLAPTILHLMGVAVPEDMDGRVLEDIFAGESGPAKRAVTSQPPLESGVYGAVPSGSGESEMKKKLQALGYLD